MASNYKSGYASDAILSVNKGGCAGHAIKTKRVKCCEVTQVGMFREECWLVSMGVGITSSWGADPGRSPRFL